MSNRSVESRHWEQVEQFITHWIFAENLPNSGMYTRARHRNTFARAEDISAFPNIKIQLLDPESFETSLHNRLLDDGDPRKNIIILIGGLGSGKTTTTCQLIGNLRSSPRGGRGTRREIVKSIFEGNTLGSREPSAKVAPKVLLKFWSDLADSVIDDFSSSTLTVERRAGLRLSVLREIADFAEARSIQIPPSIYDLDLPRPISRISNTDKIPQSSRTICQKYIRSLGATEEDSDFPELLNATICYLTDKHREGAAPKHIVFVADNLDRVVASSATAAMAAVRRATYNCHDVRTLIPLRPTSLVSDPEFYGFVDSVAHYSPTEFELMSQRLQYFIFSRSRQELRDGYEIEDSTDPAAPKRVNLFLNTPSEFEIDFLLAACCLFRAVMWYGLNLPEPDGTPHPPITAFHPDHACFGGISLDLDAGMDMARMLKTVNGSNLRSAFIHAQSILERMYAEPKPLEKAIVEVKARKLLRPRDAPESAENGPVLVEPISYVAESILIGDSGRLGSELIVNLFEPVEEEWPPAGRSRPVGLVHLYVLKCIAKHRVVNNARLRRTLSLFGISQKQIRSSTSSLAQSMSKLVWPSERDGSKDSTSFTLSERGVSYVEDLDYRFDYLWACSAALNPLAGARNFRAKVEAVEWLLDGLLHVECRHLRWCLIAGFPDGDFGLETIRSYLHVLPICYRAVASLSEISSGVLWKRSRASAPEDYSRDIVSAMGAIALLLERVERSFVCLFGTVEVRGLFKKERLKAEGRLSGYLKVARKFGSGSQEERTLRLLADNDADNDANMQILFDGYEANVGNLIARLVGGSRGSISQFTDDVVSALAQYGAGLVKLSGLGALLESVKEAEKTRIGFRVLAARMGYLSISVEHLTPSIGEINRRLLDIRESVGQQISAVRDSPGGPNSRVMLQLEELRDFVASAQGQSAGLLVRAREGVDGSDRSHDRARQVLEGYEALVQEVRLICAELR